MKILALDPSGKNGDVGWCLLDNIKKEIRYGAISYNSFSVKKSSVNKMDIVISEDYNTMFNNGDSYIINKTNEYIKSKCTEVPFKLVQPQDRTVVPKCVLNKIIKKDTSHHKDATSAVAHAIAYACKIDFEYNLYLMNELED